MLNRLGGQMVTLAGKTKALAEEALIALDAHDDEEPAAPAAFSEPVCNDQNTSFLLQALVEAISGQVMHDPVSPEQVEVLITQLNLIREQAPKDAGSILELVARPSPTSTALLDALQTEQLEQSKLRDRMETESKTWRLKLEEAERLLRNSEKRQAELTDQIEHENIEKISLNRMLAKIVREKAELELERDNNELVDSRIMKSLLVSIGSQVENKPVRNSLLMIAADILHMSPEERDKGCIPLSLEAMQAKPPSLANAFMEFLEEEVAPPDGISN